MNPRGLLKYALILAFCLALLPFPQSARAQAETGYDLIARVNELRASRGLAPYTVDPWIMDYAQQHTQYQADIQQSTHEHSDGTVSLAVGLRENVAGGDFGYVTTDIVVNQIWVDWGHLNVMIGFESGAAGAGVAVDAEGTVYYTLNVRPGAEVGDKEATANPPSNATTNPSVISSPTPAQDLPAGPFIPIITSTPDVNGSIIHMVKYGDSLWRVAVSYGVTMDLIRSLNGMGSEQVTIYERQKLLIGQAQPTSTPTQPPPTPTSTATLLAPTDTPSSTLTAIPTLLPTQDAKVRPANQSDGKLLLLGIGVGALLMGFVSGIFALFRKAK